MSAASPITAASSTAGMAASGRHIAITTPVTASRDLGRSIPTPPQYPTSSLSHLPVTPPGYSYIQINHHYHTPPGYSSWLTTTPERPASAPPAPVTLIEDELPPLQGTPPRPEPPPLNATCHKCEHRREQVYPCHRINPPPVMRQMDRCVLKFCDNCLRQLILKSQHVLLPSIAAVNGWKAYYESRVDDDWCCPRCHLFCDCTRCMEVKLPERAVKDVLKACRKMNRVHQLVLDDNNEKKMETTPSVKVRRHEKVDRQ